MTNDQLKQWLIAIGAQYNITEAHHQWRPDDSLRVVKDYFTFEVKESNPTDTQKIDELSSSVLNITHTYTKRWENIVEVSAHSENGREALQMLEVTRDLPAVRSIFGENIQVYPCTGITSEPFEDESTKDFVFTTTFPIVEMLTLSITETNGKVTDFDLDGDVIDAEDNEIQLTAEWEAE